MNGKLIVIGIIVGLAAIATGLVMSRMTSSPAVTVPAVATDPLTVSRSAQPKCDAIKLSASLPHTADGAIRHLDDKSCLVFDVPAALTADIDSWNWRGDRDGAFTGDKVQLSYLVFRPQSESYRYYFGSDDPGLSWDDVTSKWHRLPGEHVAFLGPVERSKWAFRQVVVKLPDARTVWFGVGSTAGDGPLADENLTALISSLRAE